MPLQFGLWVLVGPTLAKTFDCRDQQVLHESQQSFTTSRSEERHLSGNRICPPRLGLCTHKERKKERHTTTNAPVTIHNICFRSLESKNFAHPQSLCRRLRRPTWTLHSSGPAFHPRTRSSYTIPLSIVSGRLVCNGMSSGFLGRLFLASSSIHRSSATRNDM